jgi:hypothetical protein
MNKSETPKIDKTTELMRGLAYDFAGDIINLVLPSAKLKGKNIDFLEPIMLGMFLVGYAYYWEHSTLTKEDKGKQLEVFHKQMQYSLINATYIGVYKINNIEDYRAAYDDYVTILDNRFMEYFPLINSNINEDFVNLSKSFGNHFFKDELISNESESFDSHLNITIALHLARMKEKFQVM